MMRHHFLSKQRLGLLMGIGQAIASAAFAAGDALTEADYYAAQPVVLSASRLDQPVNRAPAAVTVITREMIEASGFRHLVDVLRLAPGLVVGWAGGNTPAASYLGLADAFPHWMQILVDGRSVYNPAYGNTTWRAIPLLLDDIERIEIVRGPNAAIDGLNSLQGTIHIFTRHSSVTQGGMVELGAGDAAYREVNARYGTLARNGSWRFGMIGRQDERHDRSQDRASDIQVNFRGDFQPTNSDELMLQLGASRGFWQGTNIGEVRSDDQHNYFLSGFANLQWRHSVREGSEWQLQLHHTFGQNKEAVPIPFPLDPITGNYRATSSDVQLLYLDQSDAHLKTSLATEYRLNSVCVPVLFASDECVSDAVARISGGAEWSFAPAWILQGAAMLEHHSDTGDLTLSPRLALNWLPSSAHAFRFGAAHAASELALLANNVDFKLTVNGNLFDQILLGQQNVGPEKINSTELGYLYSDPAQGVSLDVRVFKNHIYDVVNTVSIAAPDINGQATTYVNSGDYSQRGLEYQLKWQHGARRWLFISQSWLQTESKTLAINLDSAPSSTFSLLANYPVGAVDASLGYYRVSSLRWQGADFDSKYDRFDLRFARRWQIPGAKIETAVVLQNLLGEEFESFAPYLYDRQTFDRRAFLTMKLEFR